MAFVLHENETRTQILDNQQTKLVGCYMHLGRLLHVTWNKVTDKMEQGYR